MNLMLNMKMIKNGRGNSRLFYNLKFKTMKEERLMKFSEHDFHKQNLVGINSRKGVYDLYKCANCGAIGKRYKLVDYVIADKFKLPCISLEIITGKTIKVTECGAVGKQFSNIIPGSVHMVIDPPAPYINDDRGIWVMGDGEPVKLLTGEFKIIC